MVLQSETNLNKGGQWRIFWEVFVELGSVLCSLIVPFSAPPFSLESWSVWWIGSNLDSGVSSLVLFNIEHNSHCFCLESLKSWGGPLVAYLLGRVIVCEKFVFVYCAHAVKVVFVTFKAFNGLF